MSTNDPIPSQEPHDDTSFSDSVIDSALRSYRGSLIEGPAPEDLTDRIMLQVRAFRQGKVPGQNGDVQRFIDLVTGRPDLQVKLAGKGTLAEIVWQVQRVAREGGLMLPKSAAYAVITHHPALPDADELSDQELDAVSAAGSQASGFQLGPPSSNGEYAWVFNVNGWKW